MTTVYDYIANSNPQGAKNLCEAFGYKVTNPSTMSENLKVLVNNEGESALESIMDLHPDKKIILEYFSKPTLKEDKTSNCGCANNINTPHVLERFLNASGRQDNSEAKALATNTNTIIFASCLVLAVAIIFKNDK
jgi:hypothetical protein|tara:strand:- start:154 stop:558 length:405 start_codon:yes stop_codon:yes gene_type:complete